MIKYIKGNILESNAEAIVNTVNTVGVMGKGIALQFKKAFPNNYKKYKEVCDSGAFSIGDLIVTKDTNLSIGEKLIINFPTKTDWRKTSEYSFIEKGIDKLIEVIGQYNIKSIAIPPLGAGNGGLNWEKVKDILELKLQYMDIDIIIYEPTDFIKEKLKKERVKLTPARALLLYVLYDLIKQGEYVSEFSSEKVCYFLQKFGAKKYFKLDFKQNFYGPYSGKVRFLLNVLNGSYLMGYSDMNKKPFEPLTLIADGYEEVKSYIENKPELFEIANKTIEFLRGFYSDFALEMLSSVDFVANKNKSFEKELIKSELENWSYRKSNMFQNPKYLDVSIKQLQSAARE